MATPGFLPTRFVEALRIVLPLVLLAAGAAVFFAIGGRKPPATQASVDESVPLVETVPVESHRGGLVVETDGVVVPYREIVLSAEVGGRIVHKAPENRAGTFVQQGQLLVQIDPRSYRLAVERSEQELRQAEVNLEEIDVEMRNTRSLVELAEEQLRLRQRDLARMQQSYDRQAITEANLDEAKRGELTTRNNLVTLRNQLQTLAARRNGLERAIELAQAKLAQAELDLERTEVRAPISGVVYRDEVEQDSYVQPGTPLVVIEDTAAVEVKVSLQMQELHWLGQQERAARPPRGASPAAAAPARQGYEIPRVPATVVYRLGDRRYQWTGVLNRFEGLGLDEKTRTVPCRVLVPEPRDVQAAGEPASTGTGPRALVRGMFVTVALHSEPDVALLRLPERAVRPGNTVWRVGGGKLEVLTVPVARLLRDSVLVRADATRLRVGDPVVVSPLSAVSDGMPVRPVATGNSVALAANPPASEEAVE